LHVRFSIPTDWFRHAGHVHEYTPPVFFSVYGFAPEPCIKNTSPSAKSGIALLPKKNHENPPHYTTPIRPRSLKK
jgi:hypothetical protein